MAALTEFNLFHILVYIHLLPSSLTQLATNYGQHKLPPVCSGFRIIETGLKRVFHKIFRPIRIFYQKFQTV